MALSPPPVPGALSARARALVREGGGHTWHVHPPVGPPVGPPKILPSGPAAPIQIIPAPGPGLSS